MTRAIMVAFHKYQPYGGQYYQPIFDHFLDTTKKYCEEYDRLYIIDSNWGINAEDFDGTRIEVIKVNPSLRYYDAYKEVLPHVEEDLVLLMDNDTITYKPGRINETFNKLTGEKAYMVGSVTGYGPLERVKDGTKFDVVSIYDTIGTYQTDKLGGKNKFCPYLFATRKDLLMKYINVEWGDHMPHSETLGLLTEAMLNDGVKSFEFPEDKSNISFYGQQDGEKSKDLGYYHVRAGSTPAVLLAWRDNAPDTYREYLHNQPQAEYLRQCAWYQYMGGNPKEIYSDCGIADEQWNQYFAKFMVYHGLV